MDDIAATLSSLDINVGNSTTRLPNRSYNDGIISSIQKTQLIEARLEVRVDTDHEISKMVELFCKRWKISICAAKNFMSLASGNLKFPVFLLQNPSKDHDELDF